MNKTFAQKPKDVVRNWYIIDAEGKILGRVATKIAMILRGKNKPEFTPYVDMADEIVVINAAKVKVTGNKLKDKKYQSYSGYPGGQKEVNLETMLIKKPEEVIYHAVRGMLPHNSLGRKIIKKLKVYATNKHPHEAQKPQELKI
ncbi:MAG: 50S ribosomal protein L13 [Candidatus Omnitrophota bacterium]